MRLSAILLLGAMLMAGGGCTAPTAEPEEEPGELAELSALFLDHYCEGRFDEVERLFAPRAVVAVDRVDSDEQSLLTAGEFLDASRAAREKGIRFTERLDGRPVVLRDHAVACVWAPYTIESDTGDAEGIDVFQWIRIAGEWRLVSLSYTNRSIPRPPGSAPNPATAVRTDEEQ